MEQSDNDTGVTEIAGLTVSIDLDLSLDVYTLGGKGNSPYSHVVIGTVAVVTHDQEAYDHDGRPEVYLAGERIGKTRFLRKAECLVAEVAEKPGTVWVRVTQPLAGISLSERDVASAEFRFGLQLRDPILLLSKEPRWRTAEGRERLSTSIEDLIHRQVKSAIADSVQNLWSHPDIGEVSGQLFVGLDRTLRGWGIRVSPETHRLLAYRVYPHMLREVVLQFRDAERELFALDGGELEALLQQLGLADSDWVSIERLSGQMGPGAGLFGLLHDSHSAAGPIIEWLESEQTSALAAASFIREMVRREHGQSEVELTGQVLLSAFRNPLLGLGERYDTEHGLVDTSLLGSVEARLAEALRESG
jgi:hypothetical protein